MLVIVMRMRNMTMLMKVAMAGFRGALLLIKGF